MAGLGLGSLCGGRIADRLTSRGAAIAFGAAEFAIAAFGLVSATFYYDVLYQRFGGLAESPVWLPGILFLSLLWPTFFMGASLPLLARALTRILSAAPRTIGLLYASNTFGAAAGAIATTWWLIPSFGLAGSLRISAVVNLSIAVASLLLARLANRYQPPREEPPPYIREAARSSPNDLQIGLRGWLAIYALSGFVALSLEILWFRVLGVLIKATAFTFGTLLFVYLMGLAVGALSGSVLAHRVRRPAMTFLLVQSVVGVYAGASFAAFMAGLPDLSSLGWLREYLGGYEPLDFATAISDHRSQFLWLYFGIPALVIGPPTILMGLSFPLLQKVVQTDLTRLGTRTGTLLVANIAGSTAGTLLTGWLALGVFGTATTFRIVIALTAAFAMAIVTFPRSRRSVPGIVGAAVVLSLCGIVFVMPKANVLWGRLHNAPPRWIVGADDETGVSVLVPPVRLNQSTAVFVNGIGQSWIPYGGIHTILGALPAFLHPAPQAAAVIGLGSGDTVFGIAGRVEMRRIVCIEIVGTQRPTLLELSTRDHYPGLHTVLTDPRIEHVVGDGRLYIRQAKELYDIVEADALRPGSAYSGNLYSQEYFRLLRSRLKPGGLAVTWSPTTRIQHTFLTVFPYVLSYGHVMLGSNEPIRIDAEAIRVRLNSAAVHDYFMNSGIRIAELLEPYLSGTPQMFGPDFDRSRLADLNSDLFPRDEFSLFPSRH